MPNPLIKILGISAGVLTVGGSATYLIINNSKEEKKNEPLQQLNPISKNKKISSLLEGKEFLPKGEASDKWDTQWNQFKQKYKSTNPPSYWEFNNWTTTKDSPDTINIFKAQCEKHKDKLVTGKNDPVFTEISTICPTKDVSRSQ